MKRLFPILVLAFFVWVPAGAQTSDAPQTPAAEKPPVSFPTAPAVPIDQENARKAKALLEQAIQALGGPAYLNIRDREVQGRGWTPHQ
jgi:hypothetical protein